MELVTYGANLNHRTFKRIWVPVIFSTNVQEFLDDIAYLKHLAIFGFGENQHQINTGITMPALYVKSVEIDVSTTYIANLIF